MTSTSTTPPPTAGSLGDSQSPSGVSTPATEAGDSKHHLPLRAGFDLSAIKDALGQAEVKPEELRIRNENREEHHVPSPTNGAGSSKWPDIRTSTNSARSSLDSSDLEERGRSSRSPDDLSASFSRSLSTTDAHNPQHSPEAEPPYYSSLSPPPLQDRYSAPFSSQQTTPTLSFAGSNGSYWSAPAIEPSRTPLDSPPITALPSSNPFVYSPPPLSHNPFSASTFAGPEPGLSFGAADGSITSSTTPADAWAIPSDLGRKKTTDFNANPWG